MATLVWGRDENDRTTYPVTTPTGAVVTLGDLRLSHGSPGAWLTDLHSKSSEMVPSH